MLKIIPFTPDIHMAKLGILKIISPVLSDEVRSLELFKCKYNHYKRNIRWVLKPRKFTDLVFSVIHLNAPDFLLLSILSIRKYHDGTVIVLDNGSSHKIRNLVVDLCRRYNVALLFNVSKFQDHVLAIQYLINMASSVGTKVLVIMDHDCILTSGIVPLIKAFTHGKYVLAGPRDYLEIPQTHRDVLKSRFLRKAYPLVHASLMLIKPYEVVSKHGRYCTFGPKLRRFDWQYEPYHGLSYVCLGKILYLDMKMHPEIPLLTAYYFKEFIVAYHAWYSSRIRLGVRNRIDGLPIAWLHRTHQMIKRFMTDLIARNSKFQLQ